MKNFKTKTALVGQQRTILTNSFLTAGIIFTGVCLVGLLFWGIIDSTGVLSAALKNAGTFNFNIYNMKGASEAMRRLAMVSFLGMGLSLVSFVLIIIWQFRFQTASFAFIYSTLTIYIIAQGAGFGILFTTWNSIELIAIFGIAGSMFLGLATIGFFIKDASGLMPWIIGLTIIEFVSTIIFFILFAVGIFNDMFYIFLTVGSGILTGMYIIFTVWRIRKMDEWMQASNNEDPLLKKRLILFFGFILATQLIRLIWILARLFMFSKR